MKIRQTLILCIIGLILWLAWGASANEDENADKAAEEVTEEVSKENTEEILKKWQRKNIADSRSWSFSDRRMKMTDMKYISTSLMRGMKYKS